MHGPAGAAGRKGCSEKPALSLPVVSHPRRAREAARGSVERHPPQTGRHTGALRPPRQAVAGGGARGDAGGRCMPPYLLCRRAAAGGAWPRRVAGARMLRFALFCRVAPSVSPSQMPLRRCSPHLTAASRRTHSARPLSLMSA